MAAVNAAKTNFYTAYHTALRALGYIDDYGQYQTGTIDQEDARRRALLGRSMADTERDVTNASREGGTLWSGTRATNLALGQRQDVQDLADLAISTPRQRAETDEDISGVYGDYTRAIQQALADWQQRFTQANEPT